MDEQHTKHIIAKIPLEPAIIECLTCGKKWKWRKEDEFYYQIISKKDEQKVPT